MSKSVKCHPAKLIFLITLNNTEEKIKMSTDSSQWIQAEEDFHKWIENPELYPENPDTNLRQSIHIHFRKKYYNLLMPIVSWVFDKLPLDDLLQQKEKKKLRQILLPKKK